MPVMFAIDASTEFVPAAVIAACAFVSTVAIVVRRGQDKRARAGADDVAAGMARDDGETGASAAAAGDDWGHGHTDLLTWQQTEGRHVDAFLDAHERTLPDLQLGADPALDAEVDEAMGNAADGCPNPEVAAMLHGMRRAAKATRTAITGGDRAAATEAHSTYARHRSDAVAAMNESAKGATPSADG